MPKSEKEKDVEEKIEKEVEKKIEEKVESYFVGGIVGNKIGKSKWAKIFGELFGYFLSLFFLYRIFPNLSFITESYSDWLPIGFWATTISTFFKLLKHIVDINFLARTFEIIGLFVTIYSTFKLVEIFPIDLTPVGYGQFNVYVRYLLYLIIFATSVAVLANFINIFKPENKKGE